MFYEHVGQNMFVGHMFVGPKPANLPTVYKLVRTKEFESFFGVLGFVQSQRERVIREYTEIYKFESRLIVNRDLYQ